MRNFVCLIALVLTFSSLLIADTGPLGFGKADFKQGMETDRPDFTEGTQAIDPGHFQVELGYSYTEEDSDISEHGVPEALLRVGLYRDLELRLTWDGYRYTDIEDDSESGYGDTSAGFKHAMYDQDGWFPALSFIAEVGFNSGSAEFKSADVSPAFKLLWAYDLSDRWSLAGNLNLASIEAEERYLEYSESVAVGYSITESVGTYVEYFGFFPESNTEDEDDTHFLNGGLTYQLCADVQFDVLAGFGLNSEASDFFTGAGVSFRI